MTPLPDHPSTPWPVRLNLTVAVALWVWLLVEAIRQLLGIIPMEGFATLAFWLPMTGVVIACGAASRGHRNAATLVAALAWIFAGFAALVAVTGTGEMLIEKFGRAEPWSRSDVSILLVVGVGGAGLCAYGVWQALTYQRWARRLPLVTRPRPRWLAPVIVAGVVAMFALLFLSTFETPRYDVPREKVPFDLPADAAHVDFMRRGLFGPCSWYSFDTSEASFLAWAKEHDWPVIPIEKRELWTHSKPLTEITHGLVYDWVRKGDQYTEVIYDADHGRAHYSQSTR